MVEVQEAQSTRLCASMCKLQKSDNMMIMDSFPVETLFNICLYQKQYHAFPLKHVIIPAYTGRLQGKT
jgi:hypothetical protein